MAEKCQESPKTNKTNKNKDKKAVNSWKTTKQMGQQRTIWRQIWNDSFCWDFSNWWRRGESVQTKPNYCKFTVHFNLKYRLNQLRDIPWLLTRVGLCVMRSDPIQRQAIRSHVIRSRAESRWEGGGEQKKKKTFSNLIVNLQLRQRITKESHLMAAW